MACIKPRPVAYLYARNPKTGNRIVLYTIPEGLPVIVMRVYCSLVENALSANLSILLNGGARIMHESSLFEANSFITLTYSNDKLPLDFSLNYKHYQDFMKRFRAYVDSRSHFKRFGFYAGKIRFFVCGEYGDEFGRPHFHAAIFNYDFPDKYYWSTSNDFPLYRSPLLEELWEDPDDGISFGHSYIGSLTFDSAAYIARYCVKKRTGAIAPEYYRRLHIDEDTGELLDVFDAQPEFSHQSTKPGIGYEWFRKYHKSDLYTKDYCRVNGSKIVVPRFYDNKFKLEFAGDFEEIKAKRKAEALKRGASDFINHERLAVLSAIT